MDIIILQLARKYTNEKISDALMSIYTLAGPITFSQLPPLTEEYLGFVHEITEDFTTTSDFIEGAGKTFPKGTNVSVCNAGTKNNPVYKYDASIGDLSAFQTKKLSQPIDGKTTVESLLSALNSDKVDKNGTDSLMSADEHTKLTGIATGAEVNVQSDWNESNTESDAYINNKPDVVVKSNTSGLIKNDGTVDTTDYADKSEMSVTDGTGTDSDKITIQLKTGTSATVLKSHQNISGKADKAVPSASGNFASLDSDGNLTDSGKSASDYYTKSEIDTLLASYLKLE